MSQTNPKNPSPAEKYFHDAAPTLVMFLAAGFSRDQWNPLIEQYLVDNVAVSYFGNIVYGSSGQGLCLTSEVPQSFLATLRSDLDDKMRLITDEE